MKAKIVWIKKINPNPPVAHSKLQKREETPAANDPMHAPRGKQEQYMDTIVLDADIESSPLFLSL